MWKFLDEMDMNLLYDYADILAEEKTNLDLHTDNSAQRRNKAYYIIYFVYRYVLGCETLEEALKHANEQTLRQFRLKHFLDHFYIYVGVDGDEQNKLTFYKTSDISIILEILYNRYDFWEQLDCFYRNTERTRKKQCDEAIKRLKQIYRRIQNEED